MIPTAAQSAEHIEMVVSTLGVIGSANRVTTSEITKPHFLDRTLCEGAFVEDSGKPCAGTGS